MAALRALLTAILFCLSTIASSADAPDAGHSSAATIEQERIALAMMQQLRNCDIGSWEIDSDSKDELANIEASASQPEQKKYFDPRDYGLSLTVRYVSALNEGASPSLLSWCHANATLLKFWLAPEYYFRTIVLDGSVLVLYQRFAERGLVAAVFYPATRPDATLPLQFSIVDTSALFDRASSNSNQWAPADAVDEFAGQQGAALSIPLTTDEEAKDPAWSENLYSEDYFLRAPILPLFASLGDRWAMFSYAEQLQGKAEIAMLHKAYEAGVFSAAMSLAAAYNTDERRLFWLERSAKHGFLESAGELAQALIEDKKPSSGGTYADCQRVIDAYSAAALVVANAPASDYRELQLRSAPERMAFAAARCKALGPERDALVRSTGQALRKSAVDNDTLNRIEAAELCTRGEFNVAALLTEKNARAAIILGNCDYFLEQKPWVYRIIAECGNE